MVWPCHRWSLYCLFLYSNYMCMKVYHSYIIVVCTWHVRCWLVMLSLICDWLWINLPLTFTDKDEQWEILNSIIQSVISWEGLKLQAYNLLWIYSYSLAIAYPLHNAQLADSPAILYCFLSIPQALIYRGGGCGVVGSHKVAGYGEAQQVKWPRMRPHCTQNVTKTNKAKSMDYIMNESGINFQQGGLPVQADQWHSMNTQVLTDIWQASEKADQPTLNFGSGVVTINIYICDCVPHTLSSHLVPTPCPHIVRWHIVW